MPRRESTPAAFTSDDRHGPVTVPGRGGRPRKWRSDADRQRAWRARRNGQPEPPTMEQAVEGGDELAHALIDIARLNDDLNAARTTHDSLRTELRQLATVLRNERQRGAAAHRAECGTRCRARSLARGGRRVAPLRVDPHQHAAATDAPDAASPTTSTRARAAASALKPAESSSPSRTGTRTTKLDARSQDEMEAKRVVQLVRQPSVEHTDSCPDSFHGAGADLLGLRLRVTWQTCRMPPAAAPETGRPAPCPTSPGRP